MGAFLKPFMGPLGSLVVVLAFLSGPIMWWWDRRPPHYPSIEWHLPFVPHGFCCRISAPESLKAQGADARDALAMRLRDDKAATEAAKGVYTAAITSWASLGREESAKLQAALLNVRTVHDQAATEIHHYVTPQIDRRYPLPWAIVRLHDAYALGFATPEAAGITLPAGRSDADPSPYADSDLASALNDNYSADRSCRVALKSWQTWYPQMAAVWSDAISHWPKAAPK